MFALPCRPLSGGSAGDTPKVQCFLQRILSSSVTVDSGEQREAFARLDASVRYR